MSYRRWGWFFSFISPVLFIGIFLSLGFLTSDYDHFRDTISALVLKKYGWVQQLNFVQLGIGLGVFGYLISESFSLASSKLFWKKLIGFILVFMLVVLVFPTDGLIGKQVSWEILTFSGLIHLVSLLVFFSAAPIGVYNLKNIFSQEKEFKKLAWFTVVMGYCATGLSYLWTFLFFQGVGLSYLGLLQKVIVIITLVWVMKVLWVVRELFIK